MSAQPYIGTGQIYTDVTLRKTVIDQRDTYHKVQISPDGFLILTPNNVFFETGHGFAAGEDRGDGAFLPDADMTQNKNYQSLNGWTVAGARLDWPVMFLRTGSLYLKIGIIADSSTIDTNGDGATIEVVLENRDTLVTETKNFIIKENSAAAHYWQKIISIPVSTPGLYFISLRATNIPMSQVGTFKKIMLSGTSVTAAELVRARWRPAAVHLGFTSTELPSTERATMWVIETTQLPGPGGSYSPVSTPFGYIGSSRKKDTGVPTGYNFSLWSFGTSEAHPDFINMSHLYCAGDPDARFSWYGHEGTGVKLRDWDPYANATEATQTLAYVQYEYDPNAEPGEPAYYNDFTSGFYRPEDGTWHIFGRGRTEPASISDRTSGAFVEVTGAANKERSGHIPRVVEYRGWVYATDKKWYKIDQFSSSAHGSDTSPAAKNWEVNAAGDAFEASMTGLAHYSHSTNTYILNNPRETPDYIGDLSPTELLPPPVEIILHSAEQQAICGQAIIPFHLNGADAQLEVILYWGYEDRLTYLETVSGTNDQGAYLYPAWSKKLTIPDAHDGTNHFVFKGLKEGETAYYRIYGKNSKGQAFSNRTGKIVS